MIFAAIERQLHPLGVGYNCDCNLFWTALRCGDKIVACVVQKNGARSYHFNYRYRREVATRRQCEPKEREKENSERMGAEGNAENTERYSRSAWKSNEQKRRPAMSMARAKSSIGNGNHNNNKYRGIVFHRCASCRRKMFIRVLHSKVLAADCRTNERE